MPAALTLLLLTNTGNPSDAVNVATQKAAREALGAETAFIIQSPRELPSDEAAVALSTQVSADVVVEVIWSSPSHQTVKIHLWRSGKDQWIDRDIGFGPTDADVERGRTVGFTVASMLPEEPTEEPSPTTTAGPKAAPKREVASQTQPPFRAEQTITPPQHPTPGPRAIDLSLLVAWDVGDMGGGLGGALGARAVLGRGFALRLGASARVGKIPQAEATSQVITGSAGLAWTGWTTRDADLSLGLRLDLLVLREDVTHLSEDDVVPVRRGRWLPGADMLLETAWFFSNQAGLVAAAGGEAALGSTTVYVANQRITTLKPLRPIVELGLRTRF